MISSLPDALKNLGAFEDYIAERPRLKFQFQLAGTAMMGLSRPWLIDGILPHCGLAALYGPPGCGKSFLALDMALHIATDSVWSGRSAHGGGVVYVAAEAGAGIHHRIWAWLRHYKVPPPVALAVIARSPNLGTLKRTHSGQDTSDTEELISQIDRQAVQLRDPIRLIVIDTLARTLFGADENSSADMGAFVANADRIAQHFGCLVLVVHHTGKHSKAGMRGSNALEAACDSVLRLETRGTSKTVTVEKNKEGEAGLSIAFRLQTVEHTAGSTSGFGDMAAKQDSSLASCVVEHIEGYVRSDLRSDRKCVDERILEIVSKAIESSGHFDEQYGRKGVSREIVQQLAVEARITKAKEAKAQISIVNRAIRSLQQAGAIEVAEPWIMLPN